ncbi:ABC transporter permease subunit [Risungbinella massiliensis]|uniref:ABC transporter permease subunit n=1 Tax=Risungbinella massiliensis TaxID=1329796 RepID=UPI0005CC5FA9|nr:ABC transporter permease subunit [Risungbinella massiliensis]
MIGLIQNENMKIYRRISTWIMIIFLLIPIVYFAIDNKQASEYRDDWKQILADQNQKWEQAETSLPSHMKGMHQESIAKNQYRIDHDLKPSASNRFLSGTDQVYFLISIFTVIISAGIVASEFSWGTIKLLAIRPYQRWKILLAKYIVTISFSLLCLLVVTLGAVLIGGLLLGFDGILQNVLIYKDGVVHEQNVWMNLLQKFGFAFVQLLMIVTLCFAISTIFRNQAMAVGIGLAMYFIGGTISYILATKFSWAKYLLMNNIDLEPYFNGVQTLPGLTLEISIAVLAVHYVFFIALTWFVFTKRDITA